MNPSFWRHAVPGLGIGLAALSLGAAAVPAPAPTPVFEDVILCRGRGLEVRRSEVDKAFDQLRANATLRGQSIPENRREDVEMSLLDRLVVTRLLAARATEEDRKAARTNSDRFISGLVAEAGSDAAFKRQLLTVGFSMEDLHQQVFERILCEAITERDLLGKARISDDQVKTYYETHLDTLRRPEMLRARQIFLATRDPAGGELPETQKAAKRAQITSLLERARKGEDFAALAAGFSEDAGPKERGGEYLFSRGQMGAEFEAAAFALATNQISDIVTSPQGYHIIKLSQRIPPETIEFAKVEKEIREKLAREYVGRNLLPAYLDKVKADAQLEYFRGARPPRVEAATNSQPAAASGNR